MSPSPRALLLKVTGALKIGPIRLAGAPPSLGVLAGWRGPSSGAGGQKSWNSRYRHRTRENSTAVLSELLEPAGAQEVSTCRNQQPVFEPAVAVRKYKLFIVVTETTKYLQLSLPGTHNGSIKNPIKS